MNIFQNKTNKYYKLKIYPDNLCRSSKYSYSKVMRINSSTDRTTVWLDKVRWTMTDNKDIRILLAEDNVVNSKLAEKMITKLGYTTTLAMNGEEVIECIKTASEPFDIVLMDLQMPVMDGIEATQWINFNAEKYGQNPVVIALTANTLSEDRLKCQEVGMVDFIAKPLGFKQLETALLKME